jgi:hypothetical protein
METKKCTKCGLEKPLTDYHKASKNKNGYRSQCKICTNRDNASREHKYIGQRKEYRENNKFTLKNKKRKYYLNNREKILKSNADYRTSLNYKFISYKNSAKRRGIEWGLTKEEFEKYWNINCSYCNDEISTIGIDRLNPLLGYRSDNITSCCSLCNTIKMDLPLNNFKEHIIKIFHHFILNNHGNITKTS